MRLRITSHYSGVPDKLKRQIPAALGISLLWSSSAKFKVDTCRLTLMKPKVYDPCRYISIKQECFILHKIEEEEEDEEILLNKFKRL